MRGGEFVNKKFKNVMALVVAGLLMLPTFANADSAESTDKPVEQAVKSEKKPVVKNKNSISVPGYAQINLVADEKEQVTRLRNPEQNDCYFKISIVLEDGTVIWESDLMAPGEKAEHITLLKTLPEGVYKNVTVKYDCFAMKNKMALNNARIKLKLVVKKKQGGKEML